MFLPRISQPSCSSAWLAASQAVYALPGHEGHHVVIDVDNPVASSEQDAALVKALSDPLSTNITTNNTAVVAAYTELQKLVVLLKTDMTSSLSILITFGDNDGD